MSLATASANASSALTAFLWVGIPYAALATFIVGHIWRYRYDKFGWTTPSSQLYERRLLRIGSPLFTSAFCWSPSLTSADCSFPSRGRRRSGSASPPITPSRSHLAPSLALRQWPAPSS